MGTTQAEEAQARDTIAAERRERVAAHRRRSAFSFALEEHEANALTPVHRGHDAAGATIVLAVA